MYELNHPNQMQIQNEIETLRAALADCQLKEKMYKAEAELVVVNNNIRVVQLQNFLHQKDKDHACELKNELKKAHTEGKKEIVSELSHIWRSKEFAAELMYGEKL